MSREMVNSGIPWIGDIPKGWCVNLLSSLFDEHKQKNKGLVETNLLSLSYGKIIRKDINTKEGLLPESFDGYNVISSGDIVFRLTDLQNDKRSLRTGLCTENGIITSAYVTIRGRHSLDSAYYHYLFHSYDLCKVFYGMGEGVRQGMNYGDLRKLLILLPSLSEQQKIASFLDRKCAEIDEMIALQEKIIEELKAYKQSVITEAVTKGLNPDAPMKDSGIEWIGEIPEHSSVSRIGFCVSGYKAGPFGSALITGNLLTEGKILVYTPEHIAKLTTEIPNNLYLQEERLNEMSQFLVKEGEVIFPIVGSLGRAMRVNSNMPVGIINQRLSKFTIREDMVNADYFMWLFGKSSFYEIYIEMYQRGSFIVNLTKTLVYDMPIVLHPINEQKAIAEYLDTKCTEIDNLISIKLSKIDSLNEYKKSIIYEYVTGKKEVTE